MFYTAKITRDPEEEREVYNVEFPDVPGAFTFGETIEEAKAMAKDVLNLMLGEVLEDRMVFPESKTAANEKKGLYAIAVDDRMAVALAMHEARKGLKASTVAQRMEMSPQSFSRLQKANSNLSVAMLGKFARAVGKTLKVEFV